MHIVAWVWIESKNEGLGKWFGMQCIKESSTLRVSPKKEKPSPRIIFSFGKQDNEIKKFLKYRALRLWETPARIHVQTCIKVASTNHMFITESAVSMLPLKRIVKFEEVK